MIAAMLCIRPDGEALARASPPILPPLALFGTTLLGASSISPVAAWQIILRFRPADYHERGPVAGFVKAGELELRARPVFLVEAWGNVSPVAFEGLISKAAWEG